MKEFYIHCISKIKNSASCIVSQINFCVVQVITGNFLLTTKLSVEGPTRLKEEYFEGIFETPSVSEESIPEQLKGPFEQAVGSLKQLPLPIRDALSNGLRIPLSKQTRGLGNPLVMTQLVIINLPQYLKNTSELCILFIIIGNCLDQ